MSDLKHQDVHELRRRRTSTEKYISKLQSNLNGQKTKLQWINSYLGQEEGMEALMKEDYVGPYERKQKRESK